MSCRVTSAASKPAAGASWSGHQVVYENGRAGQRGKERMSLKKVVFRLGEQRKSARSSE
jgi:hypothetical protein